MLEDVGATGHGIAGVVHGQVLPCSDAIPDVHPAGERVSLSRFHRDPGRVDAGDGEAESAELLRQKAAAAADVQRSRAAGDVGQAPEPREDVPEVAHAARGHAAVQEDERALVVPPRRAEPVVDRVVDGRCHLQLLRVSEGSCRPCMDRSAGYSNVIKTPSCNPPRYLLVDRCSTARTAGRAGTLSGEELQMRTPGSREPNRRPAQRAMPRRRRFGRRPVIALTGLAAKGIAATRGRSGWAATTSSSSPSAGSCPSTPTSFAPGL